MIGIIRGTENHLDPQPNRLAVGPVRLPWPFPISYWLGSSSAIVFGWPVFSGKTPRYIKAAYRLFSRIAGARRWVLYRLHPSYRYHMIDSGLGYGYHERDDLLLHGAMACLIGYVEDCEATGCHDPGDEAREILKWWKETRPANEARVSQLMSEIYGKRKYPLQTKPSDIHPNLSEIVFPEMADDDAAKQQEMWALEEKIHSDEQAYLHRLIDIRGGMWT